MVGVRYVMVCHLHEQIGFISITQIPPTSALPCSEAKLLRLKAPCALLRCSVFGGQGARTRMVEVPGLTGPAL